ncbi:hypothetical protein HNY73_002953 [Argiope bruennichi]|uniref:Uncharacterized protein n=1 Tax=Argiope bruennichi TaxID=94029 RepID=A0A8T0FXZ5_ARGBR|nr:hypothetical protein HNY73_002953 [Argiope bruennichi]
MEEKFHCLPWLTDVTEDGANTWSDKITEMQATSGIEMYENLRTQRRHFPFVADNISEEVKDVITKEIANESEGRTTGSKAAAGIETKIENYENIRTQRRHFPFVADNISEEVKDVVTKEIPNEAEGRTIGSKAAAGIETKIENYENIRTQRRHFPFVADNISEEVKDVITKETANEPEGRTIRSKAAAGIETKIENYESIRTQRRHFPFVADNISEEVKDVITKEIANEPEGRTNGSKAAAGIETKIENYVNIRTQRQYFPFTTDNVSEEVKDTNGEIEVDGEETIESEATAGVETIIENFENIRTQRRHFPGSTGSNIFVNR